MIEDETIVNLFLEYEIVEDRLSSSMQSNRVHNLPICNDISLYIDNFFLFLNSFHEFCFVKRQEVYRGSSTAANEMLMLPSRQSTIDKESEERHNWLDQFSLEFSMLHERIVRFLDDDLTVG